MQKIILQHRNHLKFVDIVDYPTLIDRLKTKSGRFELVVLQQRIDGRWVELETFTDLTDAVREWPDAQIELPFYPIETEA